MSGLGFAMGLIIFVAIFSYGGYIMRGVIEEKSNRIIEVITSSVKPIELLTGKMLGVATLALTQIGIWAITIVGLGLLAAPLLEHFCNENTGQMVGKPPHRLIFHSYQKYRLLKRRSSYLLYHLFLSRLLPLQLSFCRCWVCS